MLTDPIADLLTRIRNAIRSQKKSVSLPYSKQKHALAAVLTSKGFIDSTSVEKNNKFTELKISLKKDICELTLKRISKPGQRIYIKKGEIKKVCNGLGIAVISTSQGIMTAEEARKKNIGGELMCEIY